MIDYLEKAWKLRASGETFVIATVVRAEKPTSAKPGAKAIITADGALTGWIGGSCTQPAVKREALRALQDGQPRLVRICPPERLGKGAQEGIVEVPLVCASGGTLEVYLEPHLLRPHLIVVGHLAIAEALIALAKPLDFVVTVMALEDIPESFAQADAGLNHVDFAQVRLTPQTYVVVASHGNYDHEALVSALKADAPYVTLVTSRKRAQEVLEYLRESGVSDEQIARLRYPAGLDIGAASPAEIALSILAEIVQFRRRGAADASHHEPEEQLTEQPSEAVDPVCGMTVEIAGARYTTQYNGQVYYFCCSGCQRSFEKEPERYLAGER